MGHIIAEPAFTFGVVCRCFTSIRREGQTVVLEWRGQGILQSAAMLWSVAEYFECEQSHPDMIDSVRRFYRVIVR